MTEITYDPSYGALGGADFPLPFWKPERFFQFLCNIFV